MLSELSGDDEEAIGGPVPRELASSSNAQQICFCFRVKLDVLRTLPCNPDQLCRVLRTPPDPFTSTYTGDISNEAKQRLV
jgi:hypothetical protein